MPLSVGETEALPKKPRSPLGAPEEASVEMPEPPEPRALVKEGIIGKRRVRCPRARKKVLIEKREGPSVWVFCCNFADGFLCKEKQDRCLNVLCLI